MCREGSQLLLHLPGCSSLHVQHRQPELNVKFASVVETIRDMSRVRGIENSCYWWLKLKFFSYKTENTFDDTAPIIRQATCQILFIFIVRDHLLTVECVYFTSSKDLSLFRKNHSTSILWNYNHSTKGLWIIQGIETYGKALCFSRYLSVVCKVREYVD